MKSEVDLDLKSFLPKINKLWRKFSAHLPFAVVIGVLLVYLVVVWQIRGLATAEPTPEDEGLAVAATRIPRIDKDAIERIQALEETSPQIRSLFNEARNNPFHE